MWEEAEVSTAWVWNGGLGVADKGRKVMLRKRIGRENVRKGRKLVLWLFQWVKK